MRKITPAIVREAQRLRAKEGLSIADAARRLDVNISTLRNYSAGGACMDCGDPIGAHGGKRPLVERCGPCSAVARTFWTRIRVIAAMQEWNRLYGAPPTTYDWNPQMATYSPHRRLVWDRFYAEPGRWPHVKTVQLIYGSWNAGLVAAGFPPRSSGDRRESVAA